MNHKQLNGSAMELNLRSLMSTSLHIKFCLPTFGMKNFNPLSDRYFKAYVAKYVWVSQGE